MAQQACLDGWCWHESCCSLFVAQKRSCWQPVPCASQAMPAKPRVCMHPAMLLVADNCFIAALCYCLNQNVIGEPPTSLVPSACSACPAMLLVRRGGGGEGDHNRL